MTAVPSTSPLLIDIPAPRVPIGYPVVAASATIRALECGIGDDILVCLHGAGSRADRFEQNLPGLAARGYHVFALDFPGHGFAAKPGEFEYGARFFADVVQDFLHQLDRPVVFVGTSLGGHVAAMVACREPDRVRAAVLVGAVGLVPFELGITPPLGKAGAEATRAKLEFLVHDPALVTDQWVAQETRINSSPGATDALARLNTYVAEGLAGDMIGVEYAALELPTLLVWGREDRWVPATVGYAAADLISGAPLVLMEQTSHAPYYERPEPFNDIVDRFVRDPGGFPPGVMIL